MSDGIAAPSHGAVDCHAHVFRRGLPAVADARYRPDYDADLTAWLAAMDTSGITHGVLVQVSFLGTDNSHLLEALAAAPRRLRATVQAEPGITDAVLRNWDRRGVRGVRLNTLKAARRPDPSTPEWRVFFRRIADLGWHVEVHDQGADLARMLQGLQGCPAKIVVDHFGYPASAAGFDALLFAAERQPVYVKLSAPYRLGGADCGHYSRILLDRLGPRRLMWGSDWPHTRFEGALSYAALRAGLEGWVPDHSSQRTILWETPAELFRF